SEFAQGNAGGEADLVMGILQSEDKRFESASVTHFAEGGCGSGTNGEILALQTFEDWFDGLCATDNGERFDSANTAVKRGSLGNFDERSDGGLTESDHGIELRIGQVQGG